MSLFGNLEDLPLPYLLETIARNRLSGKVVLRRREGHGLIVCREGRIVYAATNSARETIGNILMLRGLVSASTLTEALAMQGRSHRERRLGSILLEMGAITREELQSVVQEQVEKVLLELFQWRRGFMKFESVGLEECGEIAVDATEFFLEDGLATEGMIFDVMREIRQQGGSLDRRLQAVLKEATEEPAGEAAGKGGASFATLKSVMSEIRAPSFTGEISLGILRFAARLVDRGALFVHASGWITGMGQFGIGGETGNAQVRSIRFPADEPSVFLEAIEKRETYRGPLEDRELDRELARRLGGGTPGEVVVVPMLVGDRVALLFYGDNLPAGGEIPPLDELELLMIQAGLAIEKALLTEKLEALERRMPAGRGPRGIVPSGWPCLEGEEALRGAGGRVTRRVSSTP